MKVVVCRQADDGVAGQPDYFTRSRCSLDGFRGAAVRMLPQAPGNAANGHLGRARRVKILLHSWKLVQLKRGNLKITPKTTLIPMKGYIKI